MQDVTKDDQKQISVSLRNLFLLKLSAAMTLV